MTGTQGPNLFRCTYEDNWNGGWEYESVTFDELASMLAGVTELAARYQVQPNTITVWQRRHDTFPEPLIVVGGRVRVWWAPDVDKWVKERSRPTVEPRRAD